MIYDLAGSSMSVPNIILEIRFDSLAAECFLNRSTAVAISPVSYACLNACLSLISRKFITDQLTPEPELTVEEKIILIQKRRSDIQGMVQTKPKLAKTFTF
ncbi:hypothetical protein K435DRAFT_786841 [Dendrothele bispora CBS 962.96]|uniref:Uncharacterized protein n=1 Tax=Dendrothele bispora (strain CBS 962.96) TaxID=1314807 RepID=A0A4S8KNU1_DENBC|nr:hypothetical protein K435DRAFT_786841 [Dendrothele bispora CBS 962.96]